MPARHAVMADNGLNVYQTFICLLSGLRTVDWSSIHVTGLSGGRDMTADTYWGTPCAGGRLHLKHDSRSRSCQRHRVGLPGRAGQWPRRTRHRSPHACQAGPRSCKALTTSGREGPL